MPIQARLWPSSTADRCSSSAARPGAGLSRMFDRAVTVRGPLGGQVRRVALPTAGQGDVGVLARRLHSEQVVRGVDGSALRGVNRAGVAERYMFVHVAHRQVGRGAVAGLRDQPALLVDAAHGVDLAVDDDAAPAAHLDVVVVAASLDDVTDADRDALLAPCHCLAADSAERNQLRPHAVGQVSRFRVGPDDEQGVQAGQGVGQVAAHRGVLHLLDRAAEQPAPVLVLREDARVTDPQPDAGLLLPVGPEPAHRL